MTGNTARSSHRYQGSRSDPASTRDKKPEGCLARSGIARNSLQCHFSTNIGASVMCDDRYKIWHIYVGIKAGHTTGAGTSLTAHALGRKTRIQKVG